jgi:hypothetical protein
MACSSDHHETLPAASSFMTAEDQRQLAEEFRVPQPPSELHLRELMNIPTCPILHPTEDEYRDPFAYLQSLRTVIEPYGCCLIVPPHHETQTPLSLNNRTFTALFENTKVCFCIVSCR